MRLSSDENKPQLYLVEAPSDAVVTRDEVKRHLRVDHSDDDTLIDELIAGVVQEIDPASDGWLGRALRPQTWQMRLRGFTSCSAFGRIELPLPPLLSVDAVKYDDLGGVERTLVEGTDFRVLGIDAATGSARKGKAAIAPLYNQIWPAARYDLESVRIEFTCGYEKPADDSSAADSLPAPIKRWIKLVIGTLYENRESAVVAVREAVAQLPDHVLQVIHAYRVP